MKEVDADEIPPEPVQYCSINNNNNNNNNGDDNNNNRPGKILNVPAWISNALFPYQCAGLQWMWEFFLKQCGATGTYLIITKHEKYSSLDNTNYF